MLKIDLHLELLFRDPFVEFVRTRWSLEERHLLILSFCDELDMDYQSLSEREILLYRDATTPSLIKKATLLILEQREDPLYQIYSFLFYEDFFWGFTFYQTVVGLLRSMNFVFIVENVLNFLMGNGGGSVNSMVLRDTLRNTEDIRLLAGVMDSNNHHMVNLVNVVKNTVGYGELFTILSEILSLLVEINQSGSTPERLFLIDQYQTSLRRAIGGGGGTGPLSDPNLLRGFGNRLGGGLSIEELFQKAIPRFSSSTCNFLKSRNHI